MNSSLKRWIVGLVSFFVLCAVLFAGMLYVQGMALDKWLQHLQRSEVMGARVENLATTESSLNMRRVRFDLAWSNPQIPKLTIEGRVLLGLEPQALVWLEAVDGKKYRMINDIHPQANIDLTFMMEPRKGQFTTSSAEIGLPDGVLYLGAIQADAIIGKLVEKDGKLRVDDWQVTGSVTPTTYDERKGQTLKVGNHHFEIKLNRNAKERFLFKTSTDHLALSEGKIEYVTLKDLGFITSINHDKGQITENADLSLQAGNVIGIPFIGTIGKSNVGTVLSWPYEASPYGFAAGLFTDSDFCKVFGALCEDPEGLLGNLNTTQDQLRKAALDGALRFVLKDSQVAFGDFKLSSSGQLAAQKDSSEIGHFKIGLESENKNILKLVSGQLPKGSYVQPKENEIQMNIRITYENHKLVVTSEGRKLFEEHVSPPI